MAVPTSRRGKLKEKVQYYFGFLTEIEIAHELHTTKKFVQELIIELKNEGKISY